MSLSIGTHTVLGLSPVRPTDFSFNGEYGQKKIKIEQNALAEAWLSTRTLFLLSYMY